MVWLAIGGAVWMISVIMLVDNDWQEILAAPGSLAWLIGMIGLAVEHISISIH